MLSTQFHMWQSRALQNNWARNQRRLRKHLEHWVPELQTLPDARREAVHAVTSFDMWQRLRHHQSLSINDARETMLALMLGVLNN